jgi:hypothetical protein
VVALQADRIPGLGVHPVTEPVQADRLGLTSTGHPEPLDRGRQSLDGLTESVGCGGGQPSAVGARRHGRGGREALPLAAPFGPAGRREPFGPLVFRQVRRRGHRGKPRRLRTQVHPLVQQRGEDPRSPSRDQLLLRGPPQAVVSIGRAGHAYPGEVGHAGGVRRGPGMERFADEPVPLVVHRIGRCARHRWTRSGVGEESESIRHTLQIGPGRKDQTVGSGRGDAARRPLRELLHDAAGSGDVRSAARLCDESLDASDGQQHKIDVHNTPLRASGHSVTFRGLGGRTSSGDWRSCCAESIGATSTASDCPHRRQTVRRAAAPSGCPVTNATSTRVPHGRSGPSPQPSDSTGRLPGRPRPARRRRPRRG